MIWLILPWIGWFAYRLCLEHFSWFDYSFDEVHHSDFGWALMVQGVSIGSFWEILIGSIFITDDAIGHWRKARGKSEEWILESIFRPVYDRIWRYFNG